MQSSQKSPGSAKRRTQARLSYLEALNWTADIPTPRGKRHRTRGRLLAATARILAAKGYVGLRVMDIAAEAGMSSGAFYLYFADREEAAREVLSGLIRRLYLSDQPSDDASKNLRGFIVMIRRHLEALQEDAPLVRALNQAARLDDVLAELRGVAVGLWRAHLGGVLHGSVEADLALADVPRPDVLDLMIEGVARRAGTPSLTQDALSRMAVDMARAWLAVQSHPSSRAPDPTEPLGQPRLFHA